MKQIVRILNVDLSGAKPVYDAIRHVKGISYSFSNAVCVALNLDKFKKVGELTPEDLQKIEDVIKNPTKYKIPSFLFNRRKDFDTGKDKHIVTSDLELTKEFDLKRLKRIKSYKGIRHAMGLPVRGQRTKGHFRHGKAMGVSKKSKAGKKG